MGFIDYELAAFLAKAGLAAPEILATVVALTSVRKDGDDCNIQVVSAVSL